MLGRSRLLLVTLLATAVVAGLGARSAAATCPNEASLGTLLDAPTYERAVICLVNQERTALKRRPLRQNPRLRRAATRQAVDMVSDGYFGHHSPDGTSILGRLQAVAYLEDAVEWQLAENLIWATGAATTPFWIVQGWMTSPSHRENMLRPAFREIGVGVAGGTPFAPADPAGLTIASEYGTTAGRGPRGDSRRRSGRRRG